MLSGQVTAVLKAYKARTLIAVIGVLLGAMSLIIVQNISKSLNKRVENDIKAFGDRVVSIYARVPFVPGQAHRRTRVKSMKPEDIEAVLTVNNVDKASGSVRGALPVRFMGTTVAASVIGAQEEYFFLRGLNLADGRIFDIEERETRAKSAILGSEIYKELFDGQYAIGEEIYINNVVYNVIGVLNSKGVDVSGKSMDNIVIVPLETAMVRIFNRDYLSEIIFQLRSWDDYDVVKGDISRLLRIRHRLADFAADDFDIVNPVDEAQMSNTLISLANILGSAAALISFLVGAIGIFSLMLLIVNQRTVEIGIKRAIGATKKDILFQFIMESGFIGVIGGVFGIVIGIIISAVVCAAAKLPYTVSFFGVFLGFVSALFSGLLAGLYPSVKASRVVPVKALNLQ